jgi:hypothetical protein
VVGVVEKSAPILAVAVAVVLAVFAQAQVCLLRRELITPLLLVQVVIKKLTVITLYLALLLLLLEAEELAVLLDFHLALEVLVEDQMEDLVMLHLI